MGRVLSNAALAAAFMTLAAPGASAAVEWAVWGAPTGKVVIGTFAGGRRVSIDSYFKNLTLNVDILAGTAAGASYKFIAETTPSSAPCASAAVPVLFAAGDPNPPYIGIVTSESGDMAKGSQVAALDLSRLPYGAKVVFGLADQKNTLNYQLELRISDNTTTDNTTTVPYSAPMCRGYPIEYPTAPPNFGAPTVVADYYSYPYYSVANGNVFYVDGTHHAGGFYAHTGLTTVENLPREARYLVLKAVAQQLAEGIQIYVGADFSSIVEIDDGQGDRYDKRIDFGNVATGGQVHYNVTVTNKTAEPVGVSLNAPSGPFSIVNPGDCSLTLGAGTWCMVQVRFSPTATGPFEGNFDFTIGAEQVKQTIDLSGAGTAGTGKSADLEIADVSAIAAAVSAAVNRANRTASVDYDVSVTVGVRNNGPDPVPAARLTGTLSIPGLAPINVDQAVGNLALGLQDVALDIPISASRSIAELSTDWILGYDLSLQSVGAAPPADQPVADPQPSNNAKAGQAIVGVTECFVATAAYGSYLDPSIDVLRRFRDRHLLPHETGRAFVDWYYRTSPPLAQAIREDALLRVASRVLLTPIVYAIAYPLLAAALLLGMALLGVTIRGRRLRAGSG